MILQFLSTIPLPLLLTSSALAALMVFFLLGFLFPAWKKARSLKRVLRALDGKDLREVRDPKDLERAFPKSGEVAHLWQEYKKTLYAVSGDGQEGVAETRWISTSPAEVVWNAQLAVDQSVRTEFFKHLPGMFTGLGIIGTFFGLINGLKGFKVKSDPEIVRVSLEALMHSVGEAFLISAVAITLAILVTFIEKLVLSSLYGRVDAIAASLDRRFQSAIAEKFLEATAAHTEEAATQLKHLKAELIGELRPILQDLNDKHAQTLERLVTSLQDRLTETSGRQIEATQSNTQALAKTLSEAITGSLTEPLTEIKQAVQKASGDQSSAAMNMLQDVMTSFSQRLNDLFGGQISGINELNQRAGQSMQDAVAKLDELVASLRDAGRQSAASMAEQMASAISAMEARQSNMAQTTQSLVDMLRKTIEETQKMSAEGMKSSADEMARRMAEAIEKMEMRQDAINERTKEFVEQIKALVASSQNDTNVRLQETLGNLGNQLNTMLNDFRTAQNEAIENGRNREKAASEQTQLSVNQLAGTVEALIKEIGAASMKMEENVNALRTVTTTAISELKAGAEQVNSASRGFASASEKVSGVMNQVGSLSNNLMDLAGALTSSANSLQQGVADYKSHRDAVTTLIGDLNGLIANAKTDASMTSDVLRRIEAATKELAKAQVQTEQFMSGVANVLGKAHEAFRDAMLQTVRENNHEFQKKLSSSVALLGTSIKELEDVLSTATIKGDKR